MALEKLGAVRRADTLRHRDVLDADGHTEERRKAGAAAKRGSRAPRVTQRVLAHQSNDRVHVGVDRVDSGQDRLHDLERRSAASAIELEEVDGGREAEIAFARHGAHSLHRAPGRARSAVRSAGRRGAGAPAQAPLDCGAAARPGVRSTEPGRFWRSRCRSHGDRRARPCR